MGFADACDTWLAMENPQNELEERVNLYVAEDSFHYNFFFLNDVETVLRIGADPTLRSCGTYGETTRAQSESAFTAGWTASITTKIQ